jgi:hypothetical protein
MNKCLTAYYSLALCLLLCSNAVPAVVAQECDASDPDICDAHERCGVWREEGECIRNLEYMTKHCPVSCGRPGAPHPKKVCKDSHPRCGEWAESGECRENPSGMYKYCKESCNRCNDDEDEDEDDEELCTDTHENCSFWASQGECTNNPTVRVCDNSSGYTGIYMSKDLSQFFCLSLS